MRQRPPFVGRARFWGRCLVLIPHPVLVQAGFALEPLAGEAQGDRGARGGADFSKREVCRGPGLGAGSVRRKDRSADVVDADEVHHPALDHRNGLAVQPDIFPDQRAGSLVVFGDAVAVAVEHRMDLHRHGRGQRPHHLAVCEVVLVASLQHTADPVPGIKLPNFQAPC